jgi:hypothetical protein
MSMEAWIEVNLVPSQPLDAALLVEVIDPLIHEQLRSDVETWFYFWEPDLRLRIRWRDPARAEELNGVLRSALKRDQAVGRFKDWYEGAHGDRGKAYAGEADFYGEEVWPQIQKDWMNGSELALLLIKLDRAGALGKNRESHWSRHVHLFTNQLFGSWDAEVQLCLNQALGYLRKIEEQGARPSEAAKELIAQLQPFLG